MNYFSLFLKFKYLVHNKVYEQMYIWIKNAIYHINETFHQVRTISANSLSLKHFARTTHLTNPLHIQAGTQAHLNNDLFCLFILFGTVFVLNSFPLLIICQLCFHFATEPKLIDSRQIDLVDPALIQEDEEDNVIAEAA